MREIRVTVLGNASPKQATVAKRRRLAYFDLGREITKQRTSNAAVPTLQCHALPSC